MKISEAELMKKKFSNEIIVYEIFKIRKQLFDIVETYSLWDKIDNIVMNILENEWISIILKSEIKIEEIEVYSMKSKKRELINEIFNKLHDQKKMHWTIEAITHKVFVFVIWSRINEEKKELVVTNIHDLNKIVKYDSYLISLQTLNTFQW